MTVHADFQLITFNEHLGDSAGDIGTSMPFMGDQTTKKTFNVDGSPTGLGYLELQVYDIHSSSHKVLINDKDLGGFDIPTGPVEDRWQTWMDGIENGVLKKGQNTIQIKRASGGDNFLVGNVAVHWRELD